MNSVTATEFPPAAKESRARKRLAELRQMTKASMEHDGLLNHAQAGLILDVSARRIGELVELGKLTRLDFLGRTYVSVKEILVRREADIRAGRPKRTLGQRVKGVARTIIHYDPVNLAISIAAPESKQARKKAK